jgi:hypothetical protein
MPRTASASCLSCSAGSKTCCSLVSTSGDGFLRTLRWSRGVLLHLAAALARASQLLLLSLTKCRCKKRPKPTNGTTHGAPSDDKVAAMGCFMLRANTHGCLAGEDSRIELVDITSIHSGVTLPDDSHYTSSRHLTCYVDWHHNTQHAA